MNIAPKIIRRAGWPAAGAAGVLASLALAGPAPAEPVASGSTTLKPDTGTFGAFADLGIEVSPTGDAKAKGSGFRFPISEGQLDLDGKTRIKHTGGLKFQSEDAKLKLKNFILRIRDGEDGVLLAFAGDDKFKFLELELDDLTGDETSLRGIGAALTEPTAAALSDTFGSELDAGTPVGELVLRAKLPENR